MANKEAQPESRSLVAIQTTLEVLEDDLSEFRPTYSISVLECLSGAAILLSAVGLVDLGSFWQAPQSEMSSIFRA